MMATSSKLNKALWSNITGLKLLANAPPPKRFVMEHNPFGKEEDDTDDQEVAEEQDFYVVRGKVYPQSEIYKETALRIEMKITSAYPQEAPIVRFLTSVYHPNVEKDGTFCHQLLNNKARWNSKGFTSLAEVVRVVVQHIDEPDELYPVNFDIGQEYLHNKDEFIRKATEQVRAHLISRE